MMTMIGPVDRNPLIVGMVMFSVKTVWWWVEEASWHFPKQTRDSQLAMRFRSGPPRIDERQKNKGRKGAWGEWRVDGGRLERVNHGQGLATRLEMNGAGTEESK